MTGRSPHSAAARSAEAGLLSAILALAVCLPAAGAQARGGGEGPGPPLTTGVNYVNETGSAAFANVRRTGARMVETIARWNAIAPPREPVGWDPRDPADPNYDWAWLDEWVRGATAAGLTPLLQLGKAPLWAQRCPHRAPRTPHCRPDPAALADFAAAAAGRYSGRFGGLPRVRLWQVLNEPNLSLFFTPQFERGRPVSPRLYRELLNAGYAAIKAVDRSNLVLAAGLGPIAVPRYTIGPMRFARLLLCMRGRRDPRPTRRGCAGGVHFDVFDVHPYTTGGPRHRGGADDVQLADLGKLRTLLRAADRAGRIEGRFRRTPLWITEFSWDSKPPDPGGLPMPTIGRWTAEALHTAWSAGVSRFFWFSLRDPAPDPSLPFSETVESGLFYRGATPAEDRPKPHLRAFRFPFVAYPRGRAIGFWGRTPSGGRGRVAVQLREGGRWRTVAGARAGRGGVFRGRARMGHRVRRRGFLRAVYRSERSLPFSLRQVPDFHQPPFG